jgi:hypothetical protein
MLSVVEPLLPSSEHNFIKLFGVNYGNIDIISDKIKRLILVKIMQKNMLRIEAS